MSSKVTIMIPTYNQSQYIEQCVESAMDQDYLNLEIVISDDSTNDKTEKIINEKYTTDPRIKYFRNENRLGRVANYHHTLYVKATGDYVLNLDGDDWLIDSTYIGDAVNLLEKNNEVMCVVSKTLWYFENENKYSSEKKFDKDIYIMSGIEYMMLQIQGKIPFNHMTSLYRRKQAMKIGFYQLDTTWSDAESIFRLICDHKIIFLNKTAGIWRSHGDNESQTFYKNLKIENIFLFEESVSTYCSGKIVSNSFSEKFKKILMLEHTKAYIVYLLKIKDIKKFKVFINYLFVFHKKFFFASIPSIAVTVGNRTLMYFFRTMRG